MRVRGRLRRAVGRRPAGSCMSLLAGDAIAPAHFCVVGSLPSSPSSHARGPVALLWVALDHRSEPLSGAAQPHRTLATWAEILPAICQAPTCQAPMPDAFGQLCKSQNRPTVSPLPVHPAPQCSPDLNTTQGAEPGTFRLQSEGSLQRQRQQMIRCRIYVVVDARATC